MPLYENVGQSRSSGRQTALKVKNILIRGIKVKAFKSGCWCFQYLSSWLMTYDQCCFYPKTKNHYHITEQQFREFDYDFC